MRCLGRISTIIQLGVLILLAGCSDFAKKESSIIDNNNLSSLELQQPLTSTAKENETVQHYIQNVIDYQVDINQDLTFTRNVKARLTAIDVVGAESLQKQVLEFYPENEVIDHVEASITTPDGKIIKVENKDIHDEELKNHDKTVRKIIIYFSRLTPGCQIDFSYRHHVHKPGPYGINLFLMPQLMLEQNAITASIRFPKKLSLQWAKRGDFTVKEIKRGEHKQLDISLYNVPYMEHENHMVACEDVLPLFAISSLKSWEEIGRTIYKTSIVDLPDSPEVKKLAETITSESDSVREKSEKLYAWVAQNINYQAIYFSLNDGWVPHKLEDILEHGYGDCKDQTYLLYSLLKSVGVKSQLAYIGWDNSFKDWPVPTTLQLNHAILYIPALDVYLNPVDPFLPFGELDEYLANKRVILASETGKSRITPSPAAKSYKEVGLYQLHKDGSFSGENNILAKGPTATDIRRFLASEGSSKRKALNILSESITGGFGQIDQYSSPYNGQLQASYSGHWYSPRAFDLEKRSFIQIPKGLGFIEITGLRSWLIGAERKYPFVFNPREYSWQFDVVLPDGYQVSDIPSAKNMANRAGRYQSDYKVNGNTLTVTRSFAVKKHVFSVAEYKDFEALAYTVINDTRAVVGLQFP